MNNEFATNFDWQRICHRAGGRRGYNARRRLLALRRLRDVVRFLTEYGLERGSQRCMAEQLGVSPATICRDLAKLRRGTRQPTEAERAVREIAYLNRRAKAEEKADQQAAPAETAVAPTDSAVSRPTSLPVQTPKWLPAPRSSLASRVPRVLPGLRASGRVGRL